MTKIVLRTLVIALLADLPKSKTEQFNKAFELYRKSPHKNLGVERRLNMAGFTEDGLQNLLYDLKQLHQISDVEVKNKQKEIYSEASTEATTEASTEATTEASTEATTEASTETSTETSSKTVDESKSIREEYPFLNDKDCPEELLIVVGKKIAAWKRYQELHAKIQNFDVEKDGQQALTQLTAQATAEFEDNQALDAELKHYAEKKEVLAAHPSLVEFRIKKEVEAMSNDELHKFVQSSKTFFSRVPKDLEKFKDDAEKIADIKKKAADRELKLTLVKNKLGIN